MVVKSIFIIAAAGIFVWLGILISRGQMSPLLNADGTVNPSAIERQLHGNEP